MDWPEKTIDLLERILLENRTPSVRVIAIQSLAKIGCYYPINLQLLYNIANKDVDPEVSIAAIVTITDLLVLSLTPATMSDPPTVQMNFNAPVYGAAGTVAGDQIINASTQDFDVLLNATNNSLTTSSKNIPPKSQKRPYCPSLMQNSKNSKKRNPNAGKISSTSNASGMAAKKQPSNWANTSPKRIYGAKWRSHS